MNLWIAPVNDIAAAKAVTQEKRRPIMKYFWAPQRHAICSICKIKAGTRTSTSTLSISTNSTTRDLTPHKNVRAEVIADFLRNGPMNCSLASTIATQRWHDVWFINIVTGEAKLVLKNEGFTATIADNDLDVRLAAKSAARRRPRVLRASTARTWKPFTTVPGDDALTTEPLFFDSRNKSIYMIDSRGRDKSALVKVDMQTRKSTVIAAADKADIAYVIKNPETHEILAYASEYDRMEWKALKPKSKATSPFSTSRSAAIGPC